MSQKKGTSVQFKRRKAYSLGVSAEFYSAWVLRLAGWRILSRRFKTKAGEIDLVARRGKTLAFVEVKARPTRQAALEAITPASQRRISRAARIFAAQYPASTDCFLRFDVMVVRPWRWPEHLANAFQPVE